MLVIVCIAGAVLAASDQAISQAQPAAPTATYINSNITTDTTWTKTGSPYIVTANIAVEPGATLTIEPGVEVWIGETLYFGVWSGASVIAKGTPTEHIVITRNTPTSGPRWRKMWFYPNTSSYFRYVDFSYGGASASGDDTILYFEGPGNHILNNCTVRASRRQGVVASGSGLNLTVAGTLFQDNGRRSIMVDNGADLTVTGGSTFNDVVDASIYLRNRPTPPTVNVTNSNLANGVRQGVANEMYSSVCVNAQNNWWGAANGPSGGGGGACGLGSNPGSGTPVSSGVDYRNWLGAAAPIVGITTPPTATFTVTPDPTVPRDIGEVYTFDASDSTDTEDYTSSLEVCWDWDNDSNCDTSWSTTKSTTHSFTDGGWKTVRLKVRDTDGDIGETTRKVLSGHPPTAAFTFTQPTWAQVDFDASASSDDEDATSSLLAQWDWEGDGAWDTSAVSATQAVSHTYPHLGRYWPTLLVEDTDGLTDTLSRSVDIIPIAVSTTITGSGGTLISEDATVQVAMYTDTVAGDVISNGLVITHTPWLTLPHAGLEGDFTYQGFNLAAESLADGQPITKVNGTYTITVFYPYTYFSDVLDLPPFEHQLKLYRWSGTAWTPVTFALNTADDQLVATTGSFGDFALVMDVKRVYMPLIMRSY